MLKREDKMLKLPVKLRSLIRTFAKYFMLHDPEVMVSMARMLVAGMQLAVELSEEELLEKQGQKLWTNEQASEHNLPFSRKVKQGMFNSGRIGKEDISRVILEPSTMKEYEE